MQPLCAKYFRIIWSFTSINEQGCCAPCWNRYCFRACVTVCMIFLHMFAIVCIWAIGKTLIEKCICGSKLPFLGLAKIVLQYLLIASPASPGNLHAENLFTPPLQRLQHVWLPCAFFRGAPIVWNGMVPASATVQMTVAPSFFHARKQDLKSVFWKKSRWALTATCSMPFVHAPAFA